MLEQESALALQQFICGNTKTLNCPAAAKLFHASAALEDALSQLLLALAGYKCAWSLGIGEIFPHTVRRFFSLCLSFIIYIWPGSLHSFNRLCFSNQSIKQQTSSAPLSVLGDG